MSEVRKKHFAIETYDEDGEMTWLGACFYVGWYNANIDYQLDYLWDNNTMDKKEVTCKRCLGMLKNDLRSIDKYE